MRWTKVKFIVEDLKGMMLTLRLVSSNRVEIEGIDLEVRIILEDLETLEEVPKTENNEVNP
jgi:hypothetical protein